MKIEFITVNDLEIVKKEIIHEISSLFDNNSNSKKWMRSSEVRKMLNISPGTLQNLRINGTLPYSKIGATIFYNYDDIMNILNSNKSA